MAVTGICLGDPRHRTRQERINAASRPVPLHTLTIHAQQNIVTLVAMAVVAVMVALVVDRAARGAGSAGAHGGVVAGVLRTDRAHPSAAGQAVAGAGRGEPRPRTSIKAAIGSLRAPDLELSDEDTRSCSPPSRNRPTG
jgi:uncharacterized protein DUF4118